MYMNTYLKAHEYFSTHDLW